MAIKGKDVQVTGKYFCLKGKMPQALKAAKGKELDTEFQSLHSNTFPVHLILFKTHIWSENKLKLLGFILEAFLLNSV